MRRPISRRTALRATAAGAACAGWSAPSMAQPQPAWRALLARIANGRTPEPARVRIQTPDVADNGNTVPITVSVDGPMTPQNHVKALHIVSDGNPNPEVLSVHFTPRSGKAEVSTRIRMARSSTLIAYAETSDGKLYSGQVEVTVTIGGCGS